eukprot:gnl/MRDRNA2_/MRDRNA2_251520_c0_seq1.p1 gnl/MRDRNA2_/MRDRNA2_251520_c0~~gnl/MRDRNA2_/MRDRNA2_251520_c0_seq1.p1  ORF type:complete len:282 (-),score=57.44 gnl/MRDRNA2_/MRDRNA2_251520_c0_seq1:41-886(-)
MRLVLTLVGINLTFSETRLVDKLLERADEGFSIDHLDLDDTSLKKCRHPARSLFMKSTWFASLHDSFARTRNSFPVPRPCCATVSGDRSLKTLPSPLLELPGSRRKVLNMGAHASFMVMGIIGGLREALADERSGDGGGLPQAAVVLRIAEVTSIMEKQLRQSATFDVQQRMEMNIPIIGRSNMAMSVDILLRNSKLESIPNSAPAVRALREVTRIAEANEGPLNKDEFLAMARQYEIARQELRATFESMPKEQQEQGRAIARGLFVEDQKRMQQPAVAPG